ncbi:AaceriAFL010Cp [[Ashbya] aceris (nom. inval.)]|nr:AaceriAFL010Cp [[Ashbya] aceris (nom. inval.)]
MDRHDEILQMFFDEEFVPQAYLDILLSSVDRPLNELQQISASLLNRLEYYTGVLTKDLEDTIKRLQKPAELLNYSVSNDNSGNMKTTRLEYYMDTLANSVQSLELDVGKINAELAQLDASYETSTQIVVKITQLELVKSRLQQVLNVFQQLQTILRISVGEEDKALQNVDVNDFTVALETLRDTINKKLEECLESETATEKNNELLSKIDSFIVLKALLKGFNRFYPVYLQFANEIQKAKENYLAQKVDESI